MGIEIAEKSKVTRVKQASMLNTQRSLFGLINIYTEAFSVLTDYFQYLSAPIYIKLLIFLSF